MCECNNCKSTTSEAYLTWNKYGGPYNPYKRGGGDITTNLTQTRFRHMSPPEECNPTVCRCGRCYGMEGGRGSCHRRACEGYRHFYDLPNVMQHPLSAAGQVSEEILAAGERGSGVGSRQLNGTSGTNGAKRPTFSGQGLRYGCSEGGMACRTDFNCPEGSVCWNGQCVRERCELDTSTSSGVCMNTPEYGDGPHWAGMVECWGDGDCASNNCMNSSEYGPGPHFCGRQRKSLMRSVDHAKKINPMYLRYF